MELRNLLKNNIIQLNMKKNWFLVTLAVACFAGSATAQKEVSTPCAADQVRQELLQKHPELLQIEAAYNAQIKEGMKHIDFSKITQRTTTTDSNGVFWYDVPVVVHVVHDYGVEYLSDNAIYNDLVNWNIVYAGQNYDTANIIPTFRPWRGVPYIRIHLATIDPNGNPTHGITRHRNYLTYTATDAAKFDDWPPSSYINIWCVNDIIVDAGNAAAYAYQPPAAAVAPLADGIICDYSYMANNPYGDIALETNNNEVGKTINHEMGHVFNLMHPWGNTNLPQVAVGDDEVDDTPPTQGHNPVGCIFDVDTNRNSVYDTLGATNYYKIYTDVNGNDSLVNYPDTTNAQNIMDYTYCARMFTKGQVARMQAALNNPLANRNNLWSDTNLINTGVLTQSLTFAPFPDLKPIPAFSAVPNLLGLVLDTLNYKVRMNYFTIPGRPIEFINESWNDTLTSLSWTFSNGASVASPTFTSFNTNPTEVENFTDGGWVTMTITATGNNTGDTTVTFPNAVFVANPTATNPAGYVQTFNPSTSPDASSWPSFNYYNNEFYWKVSDSAGYGDNYSMEYVGYDSRIIPSIGAYPAIGTPMGDFDDMFSVPFNLSGYSASNCFLNFNSSGATRSSSALSISDTLELDYMTTAGTWVEITKLGQGELFNMGATTTSYTPSSMSDWVPNGIAIPSGAITPYTVFRFRYLPNVGTDGYSSSNNFYMDNVHISEWPAAVENVKMAAADVMLMPNPTNGDAYLVIQDANSTSAQVLVTDVTGKEVYNITKELSGNIVRIQIPHTAIAVPGVYMVQATTGSQVTTKKLVVY